jgi:hypothetical protein
MENIFAYYCRNPGVRILIHVVKLQESFLQGGLRFSSDLPCWCLRICETYSVTSDLAWLPPSKLFHCAS